MEVLPPIAKTLQLAIDPAQHLRCGGPTCAYPVGTPPALRAAVRVIEWASAKSAPRSVPPASVWGTGLGWGALGSMLAFSIVLFLFFPITIWRSDPGESHVLRIAVSYLVIVPLVAGALAALRRLSAGRLTSGVGLLWAAKLLVTSTLFFALAPGAAQSYRPQRTSTARPALVERAGYVPAPADAPLVSFTGRVMRDERPVVDALVWIDRPAPGRGLDAPARVAIAIRDGRFDRSVVGARTGDTLELSNEGASLHTLRIAMDGHYVANDPLPPGAAPREVPALPAGRYLLSCASHPDERAVLVVVDHPFLARTDTDGRFRFDGVGGGTPVVRVEAEVSERARIDLERESR